MMAGVTPEDLERRPAEGLRRDRGARMAGLWLQSGRIE
jgi:hypothetical protein